MKEKIGKKFYSPYFKQMIEVVEYVDDNHWIFKLENGEVYAAKTPLSYFEGHDFTRDNPKRAVKQDMSKGQFVDCTGKTNDKIEKIVNKYTTGYRVISMSKTGEVLPSNHNENFVNDLYTLIQEERKDAVEGFITDFIETGVYEGVGSIEDIMKLWRKYNAHN